MEDFEKKIKIRKEKRSEEFTGKEYSKFDKNRSVKEFKEYYEDKNRDLIFLAEEASSIKEDHNVVRSSKIVLESIKLFEKDLKKLGIKNY